mmetsp:Transcript_3863/g.15585  ORF Transcript_3863/g.15585 Transcript_3863/m.15585 type:complete len:214 (-) Transcript_3863:375-1016(-)
MFLGLVIAPAALELANHALHEVHRKVVHAQVAPAETQPAVFGERHCVRRCELAILSDRELGRGAGAGLCVHAHFLGGASLLNNFGAHLGASLGAVPHERGVGHLDQRIVHAVHEERLHAALAHVLKRATAADRRVDSAVAIGRHRQRRGRRQLDVAVLLEHRQRALLEEEDAVAREAVVAVLLEVAHRVVVRGVRGQDVPRDGRRALPRQPAR